MGDVIYFILAIIITIALIFTMVYYVIMFSDLECDYMNPIDLCNKLNPYVLPEMLIHALMAFMFLIRFQWMALFWNAPLVAYSAHRIMNNRHMYDATEIFRLLPQHKREVFIKLGFYLISFFYYLYRMITELIA